MEKGDIMDNWFDFFCDKAKMAYVEVLGKDKWNGLSDEEKHDVVMALAKGLLAALS